jgi:hypothetical protein
MTTLREALAAATDSAGRIHSTRALALAIAEADARHALACAWGLVALRQRDEYRDNPAVTVIEDRSTEERADTAERERDEARRQLAQRPTVIAYTAACRERDEARDVVNRCADALRRRVPEMSTRGGPCLPDEVDHALSSMAHFRDEARRERDEARTAYVDDTADRNQIRAERDEARAEVERLRGRVAELEATRPLKPLDWRSLPQLDGVNARECERLVREAEERGALLAIKSARLWGIPEDDDRKTAARICREARERGEHG